jgi:hypothetical protein
MSGTQLENQSMSDVQDHEDDVDWKSIFSLVREGKTAEIPFVDERDYARRAKQATKRADKRGIAIAVSRGKSVLRVAPRPADSGAVVAPTSGGEAEL